MILIPQEPLTLFALHTTLVRTPSDLTGLHTSQIQKKKNYYKNHKGTNYIWIYRNHKAPKIRPWTNAQLLSNLANLWVKSLLKINFNLTFCVFLNSKKSYLKLLKLVVLGSQSWAKTVLIQLKNRLTSFWKAVMKSYNQPVEISF